MTAPRIEAFEPLAHRILRAPVAPGKSLIDDRHRGRIRRVERIEESAMNQRNAHGLKIIAGYLRPDERFPGRQRLWRMALHLTQGVNTRFIQEEHIADSSHGNDAGKRRQPASTSP